MIFYAALTTIGTIAALIYIAIKIYGDAKISRFGWVAFGSLAFIGIAAQFLPAMYLLTMVLFSERVY